MRRYVLLSGIIVFLVVFGLSTAYAASISGFVDGDDAIGTGISGVYVECWAEDDSSLSSSDTTDSSGNYSITGLLPGHTYNVRFDPTPSNPNYAIALNQVGVPTEGPYTSDRTLQSGAATISGTVRDEGTGNPVGPLGEDYVKLFFNGLNVEASTDTDSNGQFTLSNLPHDSVAIGIAAPSYSSGYAWSCGKAFYLSPGENVTGLEIPLEDGAQLSGYVRDSYSTPLADVDVTITRKTGCGEIWATTDATGYYEMRLAPGTYEVGVSSDTGYVSESQSLTVNIPTDIIAMDLVGYDASTGTLDSVRVANPGSFPHHSGTIFFIGAFRNGATSAGLTIENFDLLLPISMVRMPSAGPGVIQLPPSGAHDIVFGIYSEGADRERSFTGRETRSGVLSGTPGSPNTYADFVYSSEGGELTGTVTDYNGPVFGAHLMLKDSATGDFRGFAETDHNGVYHFYNVPVGNYLIDALYYDPATASDVPASVITDGGTVTVPIVLNTFPTLTIYHPYWQGGHNNFEELYDGSSVSVVEYNAARLLMKAYDPDDPSDPNGQNLLYSFSIVGGGPGSGRAPELWKWVNIPSLGGAVRRLTFLPDLIDADTTYTLALSVSDGVTTTTQEVDVDVSNVNSLLPGYFQPVDWPGGTADIASADINGNFPVSLVINGVKNNDPNELTQAGLYYRPLGAGGPLVQAPLASKTSDPRGVKCTFDFPISDASIINGTTYDFELWAEDSTGDAYWSGWGGGYRADGSGWVLYKLDVTK